jgi:hypothetical protein
VNINNKPPVFVPAEFRDEIERMSKAALMDMVWDYATQASGAADDTGIITELRARRDIILGHRARTLK